MTKKLTKEQHKSLGTIRVVGKWEMLKRDIKILYKHLFIDGAQMDLDSGTAKVFLKMGYIKETDSNYDLTPKGSDELMKALEVYSALYPRKR